MIYNKRKKGDLMEKKKTYQSMKTLSDTLHQSKTVRQLFNNHSFLLFRLRQKWKDIVGEMPAKYSYIGFGKGNTLFVYVTNSALTQHLFMMKSELLKRLGEDEYGKQFTDIRFLAGTPKKETAGKTTIDKINDRLAFREKMYDQPLTEKEKKDISLWTQVHIKDEKLRETFEKLIARSYQKDKAETAHGYHPCMTCGNLIPQSQTVCIRCENKLEKTEEGAFILILKENPHYKYEDCLAVLEKQDKNIKAIPGRHPFSYETYASAREKWIQKQREAIFQNTDAPLHKRILLSLLIHKPLKNITLREAEEALQNMKQSKYNSYDKK